MTPGIEVDAIVREGDPASIIVRVADDEGYDLIVMDRKGMGIIEGLCHGQRDEEGSQDLKCNGDSGHLKTIKSSFWG